MLIDISVVGRNIRSVNVMLSYFCVEVNIVSAIPEKAYASLSEYASVEP
jgi:hypothetical protein